MLINIHELSALSPDPYALATKSSALCRRYGRFCRRWSYRSGFYR